MKTLQQHINEKLVINKDFKSEGMPTNEKEQILYDIFLKLNLKKNEKSKTGNSLIAQNTAFQKIKILSALSDCRVKENEKTKWWPAVNVYGYKEYDYSPNCPHWGIFIFCGGFEILIESRVKGSYSNIKLTKIHQNEDFPKSKKDIHIEHFRIPHSTWKIINNLFE